MKKKRRAALSLSVAVVAGSLGTPAISQEAVVEQDQLPVVNVSAQKRVEDPHRVAMSISSLSGSELQAGHVDDITDLTRAVPNLSFTAATSNGGAGPGTNNIEIRGISSAAGAATVGIYLGETSITVGNVYSMGAIEPKFFDIDRVEVLRGPQATLYGASSMGGTIKFVPHEPDLSERSLSTYDEFSNLKGGSASHTANAVANLPIRSGEMALRIGLQLHHAGGYIQLVGDTGETLARNINQISDQAARLALRWKIWPGLNVTPSLYYQAVDAKDIAAFSLDLPRYQARKQIREPSRDTLLTSNLTVNWDLGTADLTSSTSYSQRKFDRTQNGSLYNSYSLSTMLTSVEDGGTAPPALIDAVAGLPSAVYLNNRVRQMAQEFRLASRPYSTSTGPWTWLAGAYFSNQHTDITENDPIFGINSTFARFRLDLSDPHVLPGAFAGDLVGDNSFFGALRQRERQSALFGEADYHFTPTLHATVGARMLVADIAHSLREGMYLAGAGVNSSSSHASRAFTPRDVLTWELNPANMVYASAAKGFRLGGPNNYVPATICGRDLADNGIDQAPAAYDADSLWSYEVGSKSRFFGNRLVVHASAFHVKWRNIQQAIFLPTCAYTYTANAGDATSRGAELEIQAKPVPGLTLGASGGVVHARLIDDKGSKNGIAGAVAGAEIQGVPRYNANINARYSFPTWHDAHAFVMGGVQWVGRSKGSLNSDTLDYERPAYHSADLSAGLVLDSVTLTAFVKNALDNATVIQHPQVASIVQGYRLTPRSIGASLSAKF